MIPIPLIFGAATLLILGKKKRAKSSVSSSGSKSLPARLSKTTLNWDDATAREVMKRHWKDMGETLSSAGTFFVLMRDTAMELWPGIKWPITINDEMRMVNIAAGAQIPAWIYNLGPQGEKAAQIWIHLRTLAWDITDYRPPN